MKIFTPLGQSELHPSLKDSDGGLLVVADRPRRGALVEHMTALERVSRGHATEQDWIWFRETYAK